MLFLDPQFVSALIIIHAVFGGIALVAGPAAMMAMKGGRVHRAFGKLFFYTMAITSILALVISNFPGHKNLFLFLVGIFTIYMICTGYRFLSLDNLHKGQKPEIVDWMLTIGMGLFGTAFLLIGIAQLSGLWILVGERSFGIVMVVFASISILMVRQDINSYMGKVRYRNHWILIHLSRMLGANIAAFTAFLVVNNKLLPGIVAWLLPTVIGVPLIFYWTNKQKNLRGMKIEPKK
jgi:uncharacterized membrane protein